MRSETIGLIIIIIIIIPNISVLWQVFDNTLNTLQFHQNTMLQLYNAYKKLWRIKGKYNLEKYMA